MQNIWPLLFIIQTILTINIIIIYIWLHYITYGKIYYCYITLNFKWSYYVIVNG